MTSGKAKSSYVVKFAATEADQDLLQAVDRALEDQSYKSFSDLCKQALRMLLTADTTASLPMLAVLEQQLMTLQLQMMQLQRSEQPHTIQQLAQQVQQLNERIMQLEQKVESAAPASPTEVEPESESDPLLSRLAPLLEDF